MNKAYYWYVYHVECYGDMFAKKRCRCTKPITGRYPVLSVAETCKLRNAVDVQSLLLVCILCRVLRR